MKVVYTHSNPMRVEFSWATGYQAASQAAHECAHADNNQRFFGFMLPNMDFNDIIPFLSTCKRVCTNVSYRVQNEARDQTCLRTKLKQC